MNKRMRLSKSKKEALASVLPLLEKQGVVIPENLKRKLGNGGGFKLNRIQVCAINRGLNKYQRVVVLTTGRNAGFRVMALADFLNKQKHMAAFNAKKAAS